MILTLHHTWYIQKLFKGEKSIFNQYPSGERVLVLYSQLSWYTIHLQQIMVIVLPMSM